MPLVFLSSEHPHLHVDLLTIAAPHIDTQQLADKSTNSLLNYSISDHAEHFLITPCSKLSCEYIAQCIYPKELHSNNDWEQLSKCYHVIFNTALSLECHSTAIHLDLSSAKSQASIEKILDVIIESYHQFSQSVRAKKKVLYTYILLGSLDIFELSERSFAQISPYIYEDKDLEQHDSLLTQASLSAFLQDSNESFATMLLRLIHEKGLNEIDCYKKANVDRKLFSKIKNTPEYQPNKLTAIAFALALELNIKEASALLRSAGLSFSSCHIFDRIVEFHICHGIYDKELINKVLLKHQSPQLLS